MPSKQAYKSTAWPQISDHICGSGFTSATTITYTSSLPSSTSGAALSTTGIDITGGGGTNAYAVLVRWQNADLALFANGTKTFV